MRISLALVSLALASLCLHCGDDDDSTNGTGNGPAFSATVTGPKAQSAGNAYVVWNITAGPEDYTYRHGSGTSSGGRVSVSVPVAKDASGAVSLPDDALNISQNASIKVGVGIIALVDSSASLPEGKLTKDQSKDVEKKALGLSARHALIYRGSDVTSETTKWVNSFPVGLSCGRCVAGVKSEENPSGFDSFEPVDCSSLEVDTDLESLDACNWT